jgi:hypothetical protein
MSGTRGGLGRIVAMGIGLAVAMLLSVVAEARAGKYEVAQCGWYIGADAGWADTTGGSKFRPDAWCVPPAGADPFDGAHMKSLTRTGQGTVSGTRFARWRWEAPGGTGISQVRGTWWHALHDGFEQRIGVGTWSGGFNVLAAAGGTDVAPREFVAGINPPQPALEDRLLCAKPESRWCNLDPGSWSSIRALTITVQDDHVPAADIGGQVLAGGWRRGGQHVGFWGGETGGGIRWSEVSVDGARVNLTEYPCAKALVGGVWKATQMRPCPLGPAAEMTIDTARFSDGPHSIHHCVTDFAGNVGCSPIHVIAIDNNPPAHVRNLRLAGGEGWRRVDDFDFSWTNPDQGPASPISGAYWRITGPAGYDSGIKLAASANIAAIPDRFVPAPGLYSFHLWLRDEAGNAAASSAVQVPLRFDDVPPGVAFAVGDPLAIPEQISATVTDAHSHPASGSISYRRLNAEGWTELPTKLQHDPLSAAKATLLARTPELAPGTYVFRAETVDGAGNPGSTTLRADGTEMAIRKVPPPVAPKLALPPRAKTRLFARLGGGRGRGDALTVPFAAPALVSGRLTRADGAGVAARELRIVTRPSHGLAPVAAATATTGERGGFQLRLGPGPSRRVAVSFPGDGGLEPARRPSLELRVRSGLSLRAVPLSLKTGQVVRLSGRVRSRGAPIPRRGKLVAIQYLEAATHRWRPVLVTRSDHHGRFRARYRFRYVSGAASIRLRATALAEERWPYAPGSSRPVTVRVRGR